MAPSYPYPTSNTDLIDKLDLVEHFEGGFFKQTEVLSPDAATGNSAATQIYYLLSPKSARGGMHMNQHATYHVHHAGRSLYTLIKPPSSPDELPIVKRIVMGTDIAAGEVLQLFVEGGWWKASEIPPEDVESVKKGEADPERVGCLITEVVVPGWTPEQHGFLTLEMLKDMWHGKDGWQQYQRFLREVTHAEKNIFGLESNLWLSRSIFR